MTSKVVSNLVARMKKSYKKEEDGGEADHKLRNNGNQVSTAQVPSKPIRRHRLPALMVPDLSRADIDRLNREAQDFQITHGGLLKDLSRLGEDGNVAGAYTVGVSLHPSPFPRRLFEEACAIQTVLQKLYVAISLDPSWMKHTLKDLIASDSLTRTLWSVYEAAATAGSRYTDGVSACIFRSDYMLEIGGNSILELKQVEVNTISCAGAVHGQRVADMHRHMYNIGSYRHLHPGLVDREYFGEEFEVPSSDNVGGIFRVLETAHYAYLQNRINVRGDEDRQTCILMVVQPVNHNIADERPIEYALWSRDPSIPCFRIEWGRDMLERTSLTPTKTLLFHAPHSHQVYEVSVAYFRAGFEPREYEGRLERVGFDARVRFENSKAVMCPDILTHLTGSKRVQQALCSAAEVERHLDPGDAQRLCRFFVSMYALDESVEGTKAKDIASDPQTASRYVLKPSRDGGGHNIYRDNIVPFLNQLPHHKWAEYVLMQMIEPVVCENVLVSTKGVWKGDIISELGIWGGCVWSRKAPAFVIVNDRIGWSVRSKRPDIDEMSVVKGYGCFDSIVLVDTDTAAS